MNEQLCINTMTAHTEILADSRARGRAVYSFESIAGLSVIDGERFRRRRTDSFRERRRPDGSADGEVCSALQARDGIWSQGAIS